MKNQFPKVNIIIAAKNSEKTLGKTLKSIAQLYKYKVIDNSEEGFIPVKNIGFLKSSGDLVRNFIKNYKKYERKPVSFVIPPSKIIVDYLTDK